MKADKIRDNIDIELSRTYFGGSSPKRNVTQNIEPPKKNSTVKIILLTVLLLLLAISGAIYFVMRDQVHFTVNINLGEPSEETTSAVTAVPIAGDGSTLVLFDFEKDDESWEIPSWTAEKSDYVASSLAWSNEMASSGTGSIVFTADMPAKKWSGALVEMQQYLDLNGFDTLSADIYLPPEAISGLKGKMILTIGDDWKFIEMSRSQKLIPGKWNTIEASIADGSRDWKRILADENFRSDIRKISIRIESDKNPAWTGNVHLDNVRAKQGQ